jgi:hypothetical protein
LVNYSKKTIPLIFWMFFVVSLVGCRGEMPGFSPTQTLTPSPTSTSTPTETPTPTSTPLPPVGVLLVPPGAATGFATEIQSLLAQWIPEIGYRFQLRPSLSEADLYRDDFRLVVALPPNQDILTMVTNHPEIQFLTIGIQGLEPAQNLSTIGADGNRLDHQGFIAGYIAAMITPDWRVGVLGLSESENTIAARQAFYTGVKFYCGLCLPSYPPWYEYPLYFELGTDADTIAWRTAADYMIQRAVETVYVVPGAGDDAMLRYLSDAGVNIIAGRSPLVDIQEHWVASLQFDLMSSFVDFWPVFVASPDPQAVTIPLDITDINSELLSPGKQRLVTDIMADMLAGYIDLGVDVAPNP